MKRKILSPEMKSGLRKLADKMLNIAFGCSVLFVVWLLLQVTTFASFKIPTDSMEPTLLPGDNILVNKS